MWEGGNQKLKIEVHILQQRPFQLDTRVDHYNGQLDDAKLCKWNHFLHVTIDHDRMRQVYRDKP